MSQTLTPFAKVEDLIAQAVSLAHDDETFAFEVGRLQLALSRQRMSPRGRIAQNAWAILAATQSSGIVRVSQFQSCFRPRRKLPAWANQVAGRFPQQPLVSSGLQRSEPDHYATLGLDRRCTAAQIRAAYRILAKRHHPDVNPASPDSMAQTQRINAAYEILSDPEQRNAYDLTRDTPKARAVPSRTAKIDRNVSQDLHLKIEDFFRGTKREVLVRDPANPNGAENYELVVPPDTAPGARFRLRRTAPFEGGFVNVRVRLQPGFRFKARGSDLRCDLRITTQRATQGGQETIVGATGSRVLVRIAPGVARGEILRIPGEGLPKPRGGRGDLLVRITYRPEVRFSRPSGQ